MDSQEITGDVHDENFSPSIQEQMEKAFNKVDELKKESPEEDLEGEVIEVPDEEDNDDVIIEEEKGISHTEEDLKDSKEVKAVESEDPPKRNAREERRHKYAAISAKMAVEKENEELRARLADALSSQTYHFKENIQNKLERAEAERIKALEEGDKQALLEADKAVHRALREQENLNAWEMEEQRRMTAPPQASQNIADYVPNQLEKQRIDDFFYDHPDLFPKSPTFNSDLYAQIDGYAKHLQRENPEYFLSEEYFVALNDYTADLRKASMATKQVAPSAPKVQEKSAPVGGVRGAQSGGTKQPIRITLTENEKYWIARGQVKQEDLIKNKLEAIKAKRV